MPEIRGVEQMLTSLRANFAAFPYWHREIDLMIAETSVGWDDRAVRSQPGLFPTPGACDD